jgi:hypothetical protein
MKLTLKILIILSVNFCLKIDAQNNLVPNSSLESPSLWYGYGTPDFCNANFQTVPSNTFGHQYAHTGYGYVGIGTYVSQMFYREYIGVQLNNALVVGQTYYVNFYVSLADTDCYAVKNIGALFTNSMFNPPGASVSTTPQIENNGGIITDKTNWIQITGSFIAAGGEKYLTIGNFSNDTATLKQYVGNGGGVNVPDSYYYIDDVYVGETPLGVQAIEQDSKIRLYPNPNNGTMTLEYNIDQEGELQVWDVTGKLVATYKLNSRINSMKITDNILINGVYYYSLIVNKKRLFTDKLVIIK